MQENNFDMIPVVSSQIAAVGFNEVTSQIKIQFSKGGEYLYDNCTEDEFNELVNAPSVGIQFGQSIKGIKPYRRIG